MRARRNVAMHSLLNCTKVAILALAMAGGSAIIAATVAGWFQHVYTCFTTERWGFLIAGALFAPIAVIHGWGIWLGFW